MALNNLDKKLEKYCNYSSGFYVELGANDGLDQSNSFYFESKKNWKGILIEPSPNNFLKCKKNRSDKNKFFCNACVGFDYKEEYVEMIYSNLMTLSNSLETDRQDKKAFLASGKKYLSAFEENFLYGAKAKTLNQILIEAEAPKLIDFLSLDVEGSELAVLKGIDFETYSFNFLLIETQSLTKIKNFLSQHSYLLESQFSDHDFLFKKN